METAQIAIILAAPPQEEIILDAVSWTEYADGRFEVAQPDGSTRFFAAKEWVDWRIF